jgi:hypothetical protein
MASWRKTKVSTDNIRTILNEFSGSDEDTSVSESEYKYNTDDKNDGETREVSAHRNYSGKANSDLKAW